MNLALRRSAAAFSLAALTLAVPAFAQQADPQPHDQAGQPSQPAPGQGMGMGGMMGGMGGMMGCPMMSGGAMGGGTMGGSMPHLPPGNEKLELQMHADMMRAMGDIMAKYAARLPEKK